MANENDLKENGDPKRKKLPAELVTKSKEMHNIRYAFSPEELSEKSKQMATAVHEKNGLADELKTIKSEYKAKTDAKDATINLMSNHITNGYEMRNVECDVVKDFDKGTKAYTYNGVVYDTVPLTSLDRQTELNLINKAPAGALNKKSEDAVGKKEEADISESPAAQADQEA